MRAMRALTITVCAIVLAGCGLTAQERATIAQFAASTTALADTSSEALLGMREDTIALTSAVIELGNPNSAQVSVDDLDRALDPEDVAARVLALEALGAYGRLLSALANDESATRVSVAATSLGGSVGALAERGSIDLSGEQRSAIGEMIARVGQAAIDAKLASAIRDVVPTMTPVVEELCDLLERDFEEGGLGFASQLLVARSDAVTAARLVEVRLEGGQGSAKARERLAAIYELADGARTRAETTETLIVEATEALRDANSNLKTSVESGGRLTIDRLEELVIRVRAFVALAAVVADDGKD